MRWGMCSRGGIHIGNLSIRTVNLRALDVKSVHVLRVELHGHCGYADEPGRVYRRFSLV